MYQPAYGMPPPSDNDYVNYIDCPPTIQHTERDDGVAAAKPDGGKVAEDGDFKGGFRRANGDGQHETRGGHVERVGNDGGWDWCEEEG